ncbi:hypothetical protein FACS1894158_06910 [Betaproteobacteria bacterium]|nr:hypothetical protein FACS1894158_06910 [Betaproteobacteria bacterium]
MNISSAATKITDFKTGSEIIARVPLSNPAAAIHELDRILDSLLSSPPDEQTFFRLLEEIRRPVATVAEDLSKRYVDMPVPLGDVEDAVFRQVAALWLKTARAYARCAEKSPPGSGFSQDNHFATLLHRCIYFIGMGIIEYQRARQEVPWGLWLDLHGHYGTVEELGLTTLAVPHVLERTGQTHCAAAYFSFILCDMAGNYSLAQRDQILVRRWASAWSSMVSSYPAVAGENLPPFVIDLMQDVAICPASDSLRTDQIRCLDTSSLSDHIYKLRSKLRKGTPPSQLALGEDCTLQQCSRLLRYLVRHWSQARAARKFRRHAISGVVQICTGFEEIHYFISGKVFEQPEIMRIYSRRDFERLFAFGESSQTMQSQKYNLDTWEVVNQSANGFRLIRSVSGRKMIHGQLLALRPRDSERFFLGQVSWLMQERKGGLITGIRALPGLPQAISARLIDPAPSDQFERVFLLPALAVAGAGTGAEQSLVLPTGWYRSGRLVELYTDSLRRVCLKNVIDSGPDFQCISFEDC